METAVEGVKQELTKENSPLCEKGEQRLGYSNLKKFGNKSDYFNKKIKEVSLITKKFKTLKNVTF